MKPLVVDKYNQYMLGVDRLDQRMSYYQFNRKSVRWWRKVFFWVLEVMIVNASILYLAHTDARRKLTRKEFRREIVLDLYCAQNSNQQQFIVLHLDVTKPLSVLEDPTSLINHLFVEIAESAVSVVLVVRGV